MRTMIAAAALLAAAPAAADGPYALRTTDSLTLREAAAVQDALDARRVRVCAAAPAKAELDVDVGTAGEFAAALAAAYGVAVSERDDGVFFHDAGRAPRPLPRQTMFAPEFERPGAIVLSMSFTTLERVMDAVRGRTGLRVEIADPPVRRPFTLDWNGPLSGLLDRLAVLSGLEWQHTPGRIVWTKPPYC